MQMTDDGLRDFQCAAAAAQYRSSCQGAIMDSVQLLASGNVGIFSLHFRHQEHLFLQAFSDTFTHTSNRIWHGDCSIRSLSHTRLFTQAKFSLQLAFKAAALIISCM